MAMPPKRLPHSLLMLAEFGRFWSFAGQVVSHGLLARGQGRPAAARSRIWAQMYEIGTKSVPVVMITGAFVGMTLADFTFAQILTKESTTKSWFRDPI